VCCDGCGFLFFFLQLCFSYKEIFILKEEVITRLYKEKVSERGGLSWVERGHV
jgi:hypothetical protein